MDGVVLLLLNYFEKFMGVMAAFLDNIVASLSFT